VPTTPSAPPHPVLNHRFLTPQDLEGLGLTRHFVATAVATGHLLRLRKGRLVRANAHPDLIRAGRLGGRLDCISLLAALGVFVHANEVLHVQFEMNASRLPRRPAHVVPHWRRSTCSRADLAADLSEALAQACRCQSPREAIATLDSAWHRGLVDEHGIAAVFARLPRRYRRLRGLLDSRSESGPETIMRLLLRGLGCDVAVQVRIRGVGRVDLVVDGWLIVECDSEAHHSGWPSQKRDRRRDLAAAALGYTTVRPLAEDILYRRDEILATMKAILAAHRP
jgi:very-short-patch-repair endonuclease